LLPVTNALFFGAITLKPTWARTALVAGLWLIVVLINLIGGRIIPTFTRNWLQRHGLAKGRELVTPLPPDFDRVDLAGTSLLVAFAVLQVADAPSIITASVGMLASVLLFVRLGRWQGIRALDEPLVWVLHVAFAWLPVGLLLLSAAELGLVPETAGIHALTSGAVTTMIVAVAGRAALGHTGRPLESHPVLTAAYVLITVAAICRVAAAWGPAARALLGASAAAWCVGFLCFAWRYIPILTQPRIQKAGSLPIV
jgi:uncharacterized protein involved in response to NO